MWKVLEAGLSVIFCPAQPQEGVPWVCQETRGSDSKPSSNGGGNGSHSSSTRMTPKKEDSKAPVINSQGSSAPMALQMTPHQSGHKKSHCHKPHKDSKSKKDLSGDRKKKKKDASPARKVSSHKACKDGG